MIAPIIAAGTLGALAFRSRRRKKNQRVKVFQGSFAPQTAFFGPGQSPRVQSFIGPLGAGSTAVPAGGDTSSTDGKKFFFFQPWGWGWWPWWYNPYYQTSYADYSCLRGIWVHLTPVQPLPIKFPQKRISSVNIGFVNLDYLMQRRVAMMWETMLRRGFEVNLRTAADIATIIAGCTPNLSSRYDIDVVRSIRDIGLITQ